MTKIPPYQFSVIIGLLLSDGWLTIASATNKNARLGFKQSLAKGDYVWFVFNELSHYCSSYPNFTKGIRAGKPFYGLQFFTRSLPCFTELNSLFYPEGTKIIPSNIYDLLTPVALAHLIMGDGSSKQYSLLICTDSYSIPDVVRLMNVLMIKYEIDCSLRFHTPTQPRIHIKQKSMPKLRAIVGPFTHDTMMYKLGKAQSSIEHLTLDGLNIINHIKSGMNIGRNLPPEEEELNKNYNLNINPPLPFGARTHSNRKNNASKRSAC